MAAAVKGTFPPDGTTPEVREGTWVPNLTNSGDGGEGGKAARL